MSITGDLGRLCNQIIRSLAVDPIARKFNLYVDYYNRTQIERFGLNLYSGTNVYSHSISLNESNYWSILNSDSLHVNLDACGSYFQTNEHVQSIYKYLHSPSVQTNIIEANPFRDRFQTNNDCCVHIRLTDAAKNNPGAQYYLDAIGKHTFDTLYICTDEQDHPIIQTIQTHYPNLKFVTYDEVETIQFASTCKYIVLSHGTYSAMIGYIAYFSSSITYPEFEPGKTWCGDIFSINGWTKHSLNK